MKTGTMARCLGLFIVLIQLWMSAALAQTDVKALARQHFEKGVAAFNDKRFGEAAAEFDAAYNLSPATVVLYNIGQVDVILGRSVEAVEAFERYLAEGAASLPAERQAEVRAEIEKQRTRIGVIAISTQPIGAQVRVDGRLVGKTPLAQPVSVVAGKHTIEAQLPRYVPQARELDVAGKAGIEIELKLKPVLVIVSDAPAVSAAPPPPAPPTRLAAPVLPINAAASSESQTPVIAETAPRSEEKGSPDWRRTSGYVLAGVGLVAAVTGGIVAIQSVSVADSAKSRATTAANAKVITPTDLSNYDQAKSAFDSAKSRNPIGWTIAGIGAAALAGGVVLVVTAPKHETNVGLSGFAPLLVDHCGGLAFEGGW